MTVIKITTNVSKLYHNNNRPQGIKTKMYECTKYIEQNWLEKRWGVLRKRGGEMRRIQKKKKKKKRGENSNA